MSTQSPDRPRRLVRRSIPRLLPKDTNKRTDNLKTVQENEHPKAGGSGTAVVVVAKPNKLERKLTRSRDMVDDHPKTRPALSLQGPFNPNIVGHRKKSEEPKRKRNPIPTRKEDHSPNQAEPPAAAAAPSVIFPLLKVEADDSKPKRKLGLADRQKCAVDFAHKPQIRFADSADKLFVFSTSDSANADAKPHPRNVHRMSAATSHGSASGSRLATLRYTTNKVLRENIQHLEEENLQLNQALQNFKLEVSDLKNNISIDNDTELKLRKEIADLEKALEEGVENAEENSKCLILRNETIETRLDRCQRKLEELHVDPLSLDGFESCSSELLAEVTRKAAEEAVKLRQTLKATKKSSREIIDKLQQEYLKTTNQSSQEIINNLQENKELCPSND